MPDGGHVILVLFHGDVNKAYSQLARADDDFTAWYRAQVLDLGGPDLTTDDQPATEVIFEWNAA